MINPWVRNGFFLVALLCLSGCWERDGLAPVVDSHWRDSKHNVYRHVVVRGETLYAIAFRYDQDYRQLAIYNHLSSPYTVKIGQVLRIKNTSYSPPARRQVRAVPIQRRYSAPVVSRYTPHYNSRYSHWMWPVKGRLVSSFVPQQGKKGIDIAGHKGEKIRAAASGVVAYSGGGLTGYGNLIIIKHNNQFLTAYGNNARNLVVEGQSIQAGQIIAEMGVVDRRYWGLHFEIRQAGIPVNPMNYLH